MVLSNVCRNAGMEHAQHAVAQMRKRRRPTPRRDPEKGGEPFRDRSRGRRRYRARRALHQHPFAATRGMAPPGDVGTDSRRNGMTAYRDGEADQDCDERAAIADNDARSTGPMARDTPADSRTGAHERWNGNSEQASGKPMALPSPELPMTKRQWSAVRHTRVGHVRRGSTRRVRDGQGSWGLDHRRRPREARPGTQHQRQLTPVSRRLRRQVGPEVSRTEVPGDVPEPHRLRRGEVGRQRSVDAVQGTSVTCELT